MTVKVLYIGLPASQSVCFKPKHYMNTSMVNTSRTHYKHHHHRIWGSHNGVCEDTGLLGCYTTLTGIRWRMFWGSVVASSAAASSARLFLGCRHYLHCFKTFKTNVL